MFCIGMCIRIFSKIINFDRITKNMRMERLDTQMLEILDDNENNNK